MTGPSWGRVALLLPVAILLLPVALVVAIVLGPAISMVLAVTHLLTTDWFPHPGEILGTVLAPIAYTVGLAVLSVLYLQGRPDWSIAWFIVGSVLFWAVSLLWAWNDYRARDRRINAGERS